VAVPVQDPTLGVFVYALAAAGCAAFGALPQTFTQRLPLRLLGWSNALAAGLMLGVAYALLERGLSGTILPGAGAALFGMLLAGWSHHLTGTEDLDLNRLDELGPAYGYQVVLVQVLHSAFEGLAIGAAMLVSVEFGITMTLILAVHNVPESMVLIAVLTSRGVGLVHAAVLAVTARMAQVLLAVAVFALGSVNPDLVPLVVGFGVGALLQLLLEELLPESYRQAGSTGIALVTLVAMGVVVALGGGA
jgi:zinc transporter ZupT